MLTAQTLTLSLHDLIPHIHLITAATTHLA